MGCCVSKYDDHATPEERRANALAAAESRSKANEMRCIKVRRSIDSLSFCSPSSLVVRLTTIAIVARADREHGEQSAGELNRETERIDVG